MGTPDKPSIVVCANQAWNLVNFRAELLTSLLDAGFAVVAVAPSDPAMQHKLEALGCRFIAAPIDAMGLSPLRDFQTFRAFQRIIRDVRPAAWLSWTIKPNVYGSLAARLGGVPAFPNVSGLGTAFIRRNLLTAVVKRLYRAAFARAPVVFFQNADDRAEFISNRLVTAQQAQLLPGSGIDVTRFQPAVAPGGAPQRFLMVARLLGDKGVREYIRAVEIVRNSGAKAQFRLIGSIDVANRTAISRDELDTWIDAGLIEFLPQTDDIRPVLAEADWIVLPSYREGLSRVLLEAGAMARPAITTDVPGCRDIIIDGVNGYLAAPRDPDALARAFARAIDTSRERWQSMAAIARAKVEQQYSHERVNVLYRQSLLQAGVQFPEK